MLFGCGVWGRDVLRRWCWAETPPSQPSPPGADEESVQGRGLLGWGKSRFSYLNPEDEKTYCPPHRTIRGWIKEGWCVKSSSSLCERDSELFSWNLSPAPQAPWKLRTVWFFSCECRPAQYHLDGMVSTSLVRYIQTESVRKLWHCGVQMVCYNFFSFYFSIISLGWTKKEANTLAVLHHRRFGKHWCRSYRMRKIWALLQLSRLLTGWC